MRFRFTVSVSAFVIASCLSVVASPHPRRGPTSQHFSSKKSSLTHKPQAQRVIDVDRTTQIQAALIERGYLTGAPTGNWTPETEDALRKLQSDNGWQTRMVPDSRAIIKLGLGPGSHAPEGGNLASAPGSSVTISSETEAPNLSQQ